MKPIGIVRKIDDLGRITIPREIVGMLWKCNVSDKPPIQIYEFEDGIIIEPIDGEPQGMVRKLDPLGRICLPKETRDKY